MTPTVDALIDQVEECAEEVGLTSASGKLLRELSRKQIADRRKVKAVAVHRLKKALAYYFNKTPRGRAQSHRLILKEETHELRVEPNTLNLNLVEHFWDAHCLGRPREEEVLLVYTEPLFFFDKKNRTYVRFLDINWDGHNRIPHALKQEAADRLECQPSKLVESYHYQPSGEIYARNYLLKWLRKYDVVKSRDLKVESKASRRCGSHDELLDRNLILIGSRRTNGLLSVLQSSEQKPPFPMAILDEGIKVRKNTLSDSDNKIFALVTRMPNRVPPGVVTMIAANQGRAVEMVAACLTNPHQLGNVYEKLGLSPRVSLPTSFQILFEVELVELEKALEAHAIDSFNLETPTRRSTKTRNADL